MAVDTAMIMRHMDRLMYIHMDMGRSAAADMSTMRVNMKRHVETVITMNRRGMGKVAIIMNMRRMTPGNTIIGMSTGICMNMEESAGAGMIMITGIRMNMEKSAGAGMIMSTGIRMNMEKNVAAGMIMRAILMNIQGVRWKIMRSTM